MKKSLLFVIGLAVMINCTDLPAAVPGKLLTEVSYTGQKYERGTVWKYQIWLPPQLEETKIKPALYVILEFPSEKMIPVFTPLMKEGIMPPGVFLFLRAGMLPATLPGGSARGMRAEEFDQYGRTFADLIVEELIPHALKTAGTEIDPSPDMHFITGGSSGGVMAWSAVWFRNDFFRRTFLASPTFSAIRGAEEVPFLLRKTECRPVRIYMTSGTDEPDYFFGSSLYAALNAAAAFEFAGYDFRYEQFKGEGHCCRTTDPYLWRRIMTFLWANWPEKVKTLGSQIRIRKLVENNSSWEVVQSPFPEKSGVVTDFGAYTFDKDKIFLEKKGKKVIAASGFGNITGIHLSTDRWRMYIADSTRRFIYAMSIMPDGTLDQLYKLAPLHLAHDCRIVGARDIDVLADDRVLAATELGIQGVVTFGLTDLILPLPGDVPADGVAVKDGWLYASGGGMVFRRKLKVRENSSLIPVPPSVPGYSDGFNYNRSHLIP